ncbi:MAG: hypothetical protein WC528_01165 [Patescibacteria group bacterium]
MIIIAIVLIIGYTSVIKPKWSEIQQAGIFDYNKEKKSLEENNQYLDRLKASLEKYNGINKAEVDKISRIIPSSDSVSDLFVLFEELAKTSDLNLDSINISSAKSLTGESSTPTGTSPTTEVKAVTPASKNIYVQDIALHLSGAKNYENLKEFLEILEKEMRLIDVTSLSFDSKNFENNESESDISLNLKTYNYQEKE